MIYVVAAIIAAIVVLSFFDDTHYRDQVAEYERIEHTKVMK